MTSRHRQGEASGPASCPEDSSQGVIWIWSLGLGLSSPLRCSFTSLLDLLHILPSLPPLEEQSLAAAPGAVLESMIPTDWRARVGNLCPEITLLLLFPRSPAPAGVQAYGEQPRTVPCGPAWAWLIRMPCARPGPPGLCAGHCSAVSLPHVASLSHGGIWLATA